MQRIKTLLASVGDDNIWGHGGIHQGGIYLGRMKREDTAPEEGAAGAGVRCGSLRAGLRQVARGVDRRAG